jgi:hypothetical protein
MGWQFSILRACAPASAVLIVLLAGPVMAEEAGAKALFMGQDEEIKVAATGTVKTPQAGKSVKSVATGGKHKALAVMTWVKLVDETGGMKEVSPTRMFKSGERIRLSVRPNKDGYLYVVSLGSSGRAGLLFPRKGQSNLVKAGQTYETPDRNIRFDSTPGAEEVMIVLAAEPLNKVKIANTEVPTASDNGVSDSSTWQRFAMATGAKDLLVEDDPGSPGASPALYVAENPQKASAKNGSKPLSVSLKLKHE